MICVVVDGSGSVVQAVGETAPDCSEFVLTTATHLDRLTYWADLAIALDPSGTDLYVLMGATLVALGSVVAMRMVVNQLRTLNKEA